MVWKDFLSLFTSLVVFINQRRVDSFHFNIIIIIIDILLIWEFFTLALDLLSIQANLNNAVVLDGLHSSSYSHVLQSLYQSFSDCTEGANYNWYHRHFHVPSFFQFSSKV